MQFLQFTMFFSANIIVILAIFCYNYYMNKEMNNFEYYIETPTFHCKYAKGKPAVSGREFHEYDEIVMFLGGSVKFVSKEIQTDLKPLDIIWISKEQFHQFIVAKEDSYTRLIVAIKKDSPLISILRNMIDGVFITNQNDNTKNIFNNLISAMTSPYSEKEKHLLLDALITQLVFERKKVESVCIKSVSDPSSIISRAISYIDANLNHSLSVKKIAYELHVSESTLSHKFKKELHISVYHYITEKRLSVARQYVSSGYSIGSAVILSGFKDYGNFYRICKSRYGLSPSQLLAPLDTDKN